MSELEMDEKNRLSHRSQALRNAIPILIELLESLIWNLLQEIGQQTCHLLRPFDR